MTGRGKESLKERLYGNIGPCDMLTQVLNVQVMTQQKLLIAISRLHNQTLFPDPFDTNRVSNIDSIACIG